MRLRLAALLLLAVPAVALAQLRTIPQDAKRGQMRHVQEMQVNLDGQVETLAAGAQIRDRSNRVILPVTLSGATLVKYRRDPEGRLHQVWILTPEEAAKDEEKK